MRQVILFEDHACEDWAPLAYWNPVFDWHLGDTTVLQRALAKLSGELAGCWTREFLKDVTAERNDCRVNAPPTENQVLVNGRWLPPPSTIFPDPPAIGMADGEVAFIACDASLAEKLTPASMLNEDFVRENLAEIPSAEAGGRIIRHPWDYLSHIEALVDESWQQRSNPIATPALDVDDGEQLAIGENVRIDAVAVFRTERGPIMLGNEVVVGPAAVIEGPAIIGGGAKINAHTHIHGGLLAGPVCKLGGEVHACIIQAYSNKQHAGYLGHSIVGSWVNIGAGACNSDLKNTYGTVHVDSRGQRRDTGRMFLGALVADHAKIGINATIPTGCSIGFAAQIATTNVLPRLVPSFSWNTGKDCSPADPERLETAAIRMMARRGHEMTESETSLFRALSGICKGA